MAQNEVKFWQGSNFWVTLVLLIGSLWGMNQDGATQIVGAIFGLLAAAMATRSWLVNAKFGGVGKWLKDPNTWAYLTAIIVAVVPQAADLIPALKNLSDALIAGNWSGILTAGFSILTMVYYLFIKKQATPKTSGNG